MRGLAVQVEREPEMPVTVPATQSLLVEPVPEPAALPVRPLIAEPDVLTEPEPAAEPEPSAAVSATRRVRARITRRMSGQRTGSPSNRTVLEPLFGVHRKIHPKADLRLIQRAYEVAEKAHTGQVRKSGDPYITHPLSVATILAELGMDTTTLVAALLHDTVEDTTLTLARSPRNSATRSRTWSTG